MAVKYFLSSSQYLHGPSVASDNVLLKYQYIVIDITENNECKNGAFIVM
jgi:hypothetical protein